MTEQEKRQQEEAARAHIEALAKRINETCKEAGMTLPEILLGSAILSIALLGVAKNQISNDPESTRAEKVDFGLRANEAAQVLAGVAEGIVFEKADTD